MVKLKLPSTRSGNLEDRRGAAGPSLGGGIPLPLGMLGGMGLPGIIIALVLIFVLPAITGGGAGGFGVDSPLPRVQAPQAGPGALPAGADPDANLVDFVSAVLDDVQQFWSEQFAGDGGTYQDAQLVLFTNTVRTGCGDASSAVGPFYCGADQTVYLDLDFFRELASKFGAPGDFAQAYVIAHELGHHVQNQTGISEQVRNLAEQRPGDANELSVRQELQADCLAGVWGYSTYERGILESGDLEEGLGAAASVGDDRIQKQATGSINPDTWTHGSSEQRVKWFRKGFDSGDPNKCDTFGGGI